MALITLLIVLLFIGAVAWLVNAKLPNLNPTIRFIINLVLVIVAIIFALDAFGIWDKVRDVKVPTL